MMTTHGYQVVPANAVTALQAMRANFFHTCITSPPYWGLRDYEAEGQIGREKLLADYVISLLRVFREVHRVLRPDGTLWLNLGDSYSSGKRKTQRAQTHYGGNKKATPQRCADTREKQLLGVPWRVALALQADGWTLRQDIIWDKPNCMPESVMDRCTKSHEYVFLFSKTKNYYFDHYAIKEKAATKPHKPQNVKLDASRNDHSQMQKVWGADGLSNCRSVWKIPVGRLKEGHFAAFPLALPTRCIRAGTSAKGCCPKCDAPIVQTFETKRVPTRPGRNSKVGGDRGDKVGNRDPLRHVSKVISSAWQYSCDCWGSRQYPADVMPHVTVSKPCTVLDPFSGSGTTGLAALRLGRWYTGIELNPKYAALSERRLARATSGFGL